jgi:membrane protein YdbS with pleckstrin-like domain
MTKQEARKLFSSNLGRGFSIYAWTSLVFCLIGVVDAVVCFFFAQSLPWAFLLFFLIYAAVVTANMIFAFPLVYAFNRKLARQRQEEEKKL